VAHGSVAETFSPPTHPYTKALLSAVPEMRTDWLDDVLAGAARPS
jgi:peptide/nickel transport system ATP-binding protein